MAKRKTTGKMDLETAIAISKTYPLELLLDNYIGVPDDEEPIPSSLLSRAALTALAECPDPQTMDRLAERFQAEGDSTWCEPIKERLANKATPDSERAVAVRALVSVVLRNRSDYDPDTINALETLATLRPDPLPPEVVEWCAKKLKNKNYSMASAALAVILSLSPAARDPLVPQLIRLMRDRFANNSESVWIMACLPDHLGTHRKQILAAIRDGLSSDYPFMPRTIFDFLPKLGENDKRALVPDILAYIGRQRAFTDQEPHLIHLDPTGTLAIPALIEHLISDNRYARYQAAGELAAYGPLAAEAVPALTRLALASKGEPLAFDATAAERALAAIQPTET